MAPLRGAIVRIDTGAGVRTCPACFAAATSTRAACPHCGAAFVDGVRYARVARVFRRCADMDVCRLVLASGGTVESVRVAPTRGLRFDKGEGEAFSVVGTRGYVTALRKGGK